MIHQIATEFGQEYRKNKTAETAKNKLQNKLFAAFDDLLQERTLGQVVIDTPCELQEELPDWITVNHPGYRLVELRGNKVVLEEDPSYLSYTYINPDDGWVYGRDRTTGTPELDDEALRDDDPDLWERITRWPPEIVNLITAVLYQVKPDDAGDPVFLDNLMMILPIERVLIPLNEIHENDLILIQQYTRPGKIGTRLRPPRKATEEELSEHKD